MKKSVLTSDTIFKQTGIVGKKLYNNQSIEIVHLSLDAGKKMDSHAMPVKVIFFVVEGEVTAIIDNTASHLVKDEFIEAPVGSERYLDNHSKQTAKILVIKHPESN